MFLQQETKKKQKLLLQIDDLMDQYKQVKKIFQILLIFINFY